MTETTHVDWNDTLMKPTSDGLDLNVTMRAAELMADEQADPHEGIYYLSFAAETGFLGGAFVRAIGPISAIAKTHDLGFNPGGEVMVIGPTEIEGSLVPAHLMDRLLSREEVETDPHAGSAF